MQALYTETFETFLARNEQTAEWQAIKYFEGFISETDYAPIKEQRQAWRKEINDLEMSIATNAESRRA